MQQLIYSSRRADPLAGSRYLPDFKDIENRAAQRNRQLGVTGLLVCTPYWYAQLLEGSVAHIAQLMNDICKDPRHTNIQVLNVSALSEYSFPDWGMLMRWRHESIRSRIQFLELDLSSNLQPMQFELDRLTQLFIRMASTANKELVA